MKRKIVNLFNRLLSVFNISIYKAGFDMLGSLRIVKNSGIHFNSIIDIGASDGKWSIYALNIFKNSKIIAIEPLIEREIALKKISKNHSNFDFVLAAAGDGQVNEIELTVTDDLDGSTIFGDIGLKRMVCIKTIDQVVHEKNLKSPFFLKFDTHGFEIPILDGAKNTLEKTEIIVMEAYNFRITEGTLLFHEMIEYIDKKGFRIFKIVDPMCRPADNVFWQLDLFFLRKDNDIFKKEVYK